MPSSVLNWNVEAPTVSQESASWVQFCLVLKGYGISPPLGDPLLIVGGRTWLPLHKNWLLIMGIIGRFSRRPDQGKLPVKLKGKLKSLQPSPGKFLHNRLYSGYGKHIFTRD
ncbi:hypothetical protein B0I35DRAFT_183113 [Stachybotrys elegans]|uniref:Uncharacterized protein n=1 Tax=Stachybotrys elegans TaxID=80388 RepID=A0A8K0SZD8_9HYPO|nr:hypothetical protein B0I35DRAFT_183113 [Stachybotrys elegans]